MESNHKLSVILKAHSSPSQLELRCAFTLLYYFNSSIEFLPRTQIHTPDIKIVKKNQLWEIKDIKGNSKNTIQHNLSGAKKQSQNIVITLYSTKMAPKVAIGRIKSELNKTTAIKRCLLITKAEKVIKIK